MSRKGEIGKVTIAGRLCEKTPVKNNRSKQNEEPLYWEYFMRIPRLSVLVASFVVVLAVAFGCHTQSLESDGGRQAGVPGRQDATPGMKVLLQETKVEFAASIDPHKLQEWAMIVSRGMGNDVQRKSIARKDIPTEVVPIDLRNSFMNITAINESGSIHIDFMRPVGKAISGIKVGNPEFWPMPEDAYFHQWIPGVYIYFIPIL